MFSINPYGLLGVSVDASPQTVKRSFYDLALLLHPDRGGNSEDMIVLHNAYAFVYDHAKKAYDKNQRTVEQLEKEFTDFCTLQEDNKIPSFRDIFDECVFDTKAFNQTFDADVQETAHASLPGGYEEFMCASEYTRPVVEYNSNVPVQWFEEKQIQLYNEPEASDGTRAIGHFHDYGEANKNVDNYTLPLDANVMLSDYKDAMTQRHCTNETEIRSITLEELIESRKALDAI